MIEILSAQRTDLKTGENIYAPSRKGKGSEELPFRTALVVTANLS